MEHAQNTCGFGLMAVSLGYFDTLLSMSGSTTSSELNESEKASAGKRCPVHALCILKSYTSCASIAAGITTFWKLTGLPCWQATCTEPMRMQAVPADRLCACEQPCTVMLYGRSALLQGSQAGWCACLWASPGRWSSAGCSSGSPTWLPPAATPSPSCTALTPWRRCRPRRWPTSSPPSLCPRGLPTRWLARRAQQPDEPQVVSASRAAHPLTSSTLAPARCGSASLAASTIFSGILLGVSCPLARCFASTSVMAATSAAGWGARAR